MGKAYVQQQKQREEEEKSKIEAMMKGDQEIEQRLKRQRVIGGSAEEVPLEMCIRLRKLERQRTAQREVSGR